MEKYKKTLHDEPTHVLSLFLVKLKNFWFFSPNTGEAHPSLWLAYRIFNFVLIMLLFIALLKVKKSWFLLIPLIALSLLQCWFYFESRHRLLIEPLLIVILTHLLVTSYKSLKSS